MSNRDLIGAFAAIGILIVGVALLFWGMRVQDDRSGHSADVVHIQR